MNGIIKKKSATNTSENILDKIFYEWFEVKREMYSKLILCRTNWKDIMKGEEEWRWAENGKKIN